jgi:D-tyrosyl-tRNA(Tyr) deacylase
VKAVVQRVSEARVTVDGATVGAVAPGLLVLAAVEEGDTPDDRQWLADKIANLRIFEDDQGRFNHSILDLAASPDAPPTLGVLLVSNFTVAGSVRKGRRPSFDKAMKPPEAEREFSALLDAVRAHALRVETGVFGAHMDITLTNDGPVTITLDSSVRFSPRS